MFGTMSMLSPFVFAFSICLVLFAAVQLIFKKSRNKGKRNILVGIGMFVFSIVGAVAGNANIYRDYGLTSPDELPAKLEEIRIENIRLAEQRDLEEKQLAEERAIQDSKRAAEQAVKDEIYRKEEEARRVAENRLKLERDCTNVSLLYVVSQKRVRDYLLSPSGGEFPHTVAGWEELPDCSIRLYSYVDAPNAFGVKLRKQYSLVGKWSAERNLWVLVSINFIDN